MSQNVTIPPEFRATMLSNGQPVQAAVDDGAAADARPDCVALVPMNPSLRRSDAAGPRVSRPSPIFVTHLIATAQQAPQTRLLRRASVADAQTAYKANQCPAARTGFRTRQTV